MRFSCDECGRSYVAADEVSGRAFRMRCRECGHEIVVRPPVASAPVSAASAPAAATPTAPVASASRPPAGDGPRPAPMAKGPAAKPQDRAPARADRPAFDPFEGQDVAAEVTVASGSLEILDKTPPAVRLPPPAPRPGNAPGIPAAGPAAPAPTPRPDATPRPTPPPRGRRARMLPAEDEEMLGPPGEEGRGGFPRWIIAVVLAGVAAVGGILLRR